VLLNAGGFRCTEGRDYILLCSSAKVGAGCTGVTRSRMQSIYDQPIGCHRAESQVAMKRKISFRLHELPRLKAASRRCQRRSYICRLLITSLHVSCILFLVQSQHETKLQPCIAVRITTQQQAVLHGVHISRTTSLSCSGGARNFLLEELSPFPSILPFPFLFPPLKVGPFPPLSSLPLP